MTYEPPSEIVIHILAEYSVRNLARFGSHNYEMSAFGKELYWANEILLDYKPLSGAELLIEEFIKEGRMHWEYVLWAKDAEV